MASSDLSIVLRCAVLLVVGVGIGDGAAVTTGQPTVGDDPSSEDVIQDLATQVSRCGDDSLLLDVAEARCEVERSLDHLREILYHVTEEETLMRRSLDKLKDIEARLTDEPGCGSNSCTNGGTCTEEPHGYKCVCPMGYSGAHCQIKRNVCSSNPCQNGGTCVDAKNSFVCACMTGYTGVHCEHDVDECASNPCQNGATCSDGINAYTCICADGYGGPTCDLHVDECLSDPCENGATCSDEINEYTCICVAGYIGATCDLDVDECASNPCQNGATCSDDVNSYTCACGACYNGTNCDVETLCDCAAIQQTSSGIPSGLYTLYPSGADPLQVYCDMDTEGGGWLVFQNRNNGSVDFYLNWASYAAGFGDLNGEFWLGNRNLHLLTQQKTYALRIDLGDWEENRRYANYTTFNVGTEQDKFHFRLGTYSGDAGDSLGYSSGWPFSTRDRDNDGWNGRHCAQLRTGAWWYGACSDANLNGHYYPGGPYTGAQNPSAYKDGVRWNAWKGWSYSLKTTRMMVRPAP